MSGPHVLALIFGFGGGVLAICVTLDDITKQLKRIADALERKAGSR